MKQNPKKVEPSMSARGQWTSAAQTLSHVANPVFVVIPTFLLVALKRAPHLEQAILWWGVVVVGLSVAPFLFILWGVRRGSLTDSLLTVREQRIIPLIFGLFCTLCVFTALFLLAASRVLIVAIAAVLVASLLTLLITRYWKISLHLTGMTGAVTILVLIYGPLFLLLLPLIILVGWARWYVHAHTFLQAVAGAVLAMSITITFFWLFRPLS